MRFQPQPVDRFVSSGRLNTLAYSLLLPNVFGKVSHAQGVALAEYDCPFDHVAQFAYVAWPLVMLEQTQGLRNNPRAILSAGSGEFLHEVTCQQSYVARAIPERRESDGNHIQTVEEVLAEASL